MIPTLNAAAELPATLAALTEDASLAGDITVSDGGSIDATWTIAERAGCTIVTGPPGRGGQLGRGARAATGDWLLFLHADTRLDLGWSDTVRRFCAEDPERAGVFRFALDDPSPAARRLEEIVAWRVRMLATPYGDQGLLISRPLYDHVGGFADLPLMEDVDLVRRIGRRRLAVLPVRAVTSAERYQRDGYLPRIARNAVCLTLYFAGVSPARIARIYA